ncbi:ABC transporter permease [Polystyrenella longa]
MLLPWEYGVRNLSRRPMRTLLTLTALTLVVLLVLIVVGFIRGLEKSLSTSGDQSVVLIYSVSAEENIENSAISANVPSLLAASISGTQQRYGVEHVSPEIYMGTRMRSTSGTEGLGLVRGVTTRAPLVRRNVLIVAGTWPAEGEIMVGQLAATKLGVADEALSIGSSMEFEGQTWKISGRFTAQGSASESEIWCRLTDLQTATKRQDLSLVALKLEPGSTAAEVSLFCKERLDLELQALGEREYYDSLQQHYKPVRLLAWLVVLLVSGAGVFAGMNMMYGAVTGRVRELATLQAIGFRRRAILITLIQEGVLLAALASIMAGLLIVVFINGISIRFTMGAFQLSFDHISILVGYGIGLLIGILGAIPPAIKALRESVAISIKAV